jgi:phage baseplate assembly protein W
MTATFRGISFPFRKGPTSFPEKSEDADLIRQSIIQILLTGRGERLMRLDFGSGVMSTVFQNNGDLLQSMLEAEVLSAIGKYEPRVIVRGVSVEQPGEGHVIVTVTYTVLATRYTDSVSLQLSTSQ